MPIPTLQNVEEDLTRFDILIRELQRQYNLINNPNYLEDLKKGPAPIPIELEKAKEIYRKLEKYRDYAYKYLSKSNNPYNQQIPEQVTLTIEENGTSHIEEFELAKTYLNKRMSLLGEIAEKANTLKKDNFKIDQEIFQQKKEWSFFQESYRKLFQAEYTDVTKERNHALKGIKSLSLFLTTNSDVTTLKVDESLTSIINSYEKFALKINNSQYYYLEVYRKALDYYEEIKKEQDTDAANVDKLAYIITACTKNKEIQKYLAFEENILGKIKLDYFELGYRAIRHEFMMMFENKDEAKELTKCISKQRNAENKIEQGTDICFVAQLHELNQKVIDLTDKKKKHFSKRISSVGEKIEKKHYKAKAKSADALAKWRSTTAIHSYMNKGWHSKRRKKQAAKILRWIQTAEADDIKKTAQTQYDYLAKQQDKLVTKHSWFWHRGKSSQLYKVLNQMQSSLETLAKEHDVLIQKQQQLA